MKLLIALFFSISFVFAQENGVSPFDVNSETRTEMKDFLNSLVHSGAIQQNKFYSSKVSLDKNVSMNPFGVLATLPDKVMDCELIFCKDIELQKKLNQEMSEGRLILVSHAKSGFNAVMISKDHLNVDLITNDLGMKKLSHGLTLVITPQTNNGILAHELYHAKDDANSGLNKLWDELKLLVSGGDPNLNKELYFAAGKYAIESRAYNEQEKYLTKFSRESEFVYNEDEKVVQEVNQEQFVEDSLLEIANSKAWYQEKLDDSYTRSILKEGVAEKIRNLIKTAIEFEVE